MEAPIVATSVRHMINLFENKSSNTKIQTTYSKSYVNLASWELRNISRSISYTDSLDEVENNLQILTSKLENYVTYSKNEHILLQDELMFLLTTIVNIESNNDTNVIIKKKELIRNIKRHYEIMNRKLPERVNSQPKIEAEKPITAQVIYKEDRPVTYNSVRALKLKGLNSSRSTIQSSKSMNDLTSPTDFRDGDIPSVFRLRQFFETKSSEERVYTPAIKKEENTTMKARSDIKNINYVSYVKQFEWLGKTKSNTTDRDFSFHFDTPHLIKNEDYAEPLATFSSAEINFRDDRNNATGDQSPENYNSSVGTPTVGSSYDSSPAIIQYKLTNADDESPKKYTSSVRTSTDGSSPDATPVIAFGEKQLIPNSYIPVSEVLNNLSPKFQIPCEETYNSDDSLDNEDDRVMVYETGFPFEVSIRLHEEIDEDQLILEKRKHLSAPAELVTYDASSEAEDEDFQDSKSFIYATEDRVIVENITTELTDAGSLRKTSDSSSSTSQETAIYLN